MSDPKPREFWIDQNHKGIWKAYTGPYSDEAGLIHVIEYSLFKMKQDDWIEACQEIDALKQERDELKRILSECYNGPANVKAISEIMKERDELKHRFSSTYACNLEKEYAQLKAKTEKLVKYYPEAIASLKHFGQDVSLVKDMEQALAAYREGREE
jgi:hypothetical protein